MRNSISLAFLSLLICACSSTQNHEEEGDPYQIADLIIPIEYLEPLRNDEYLTMAEENLLIKNSAIWEQSELREWSLPEPPLLAFCGGGNFGFYRPRNSDDGAKFRVVGATEAWIPVDGKVTRVLHLQMVNNW